MDRSVDHVASLKERAGLHMRCGGLAEAQALCKMVLTLAPRDREAHAMLAEISRALRSAMPAAAAHPTEALPALERFLGAVHARRRRSG